MTEAFSATAKVDVRDGLVCITVSAPGAQEVMLRLPRRLAMDMARKIISAASSAPNSFPTHQHRGERQ